MSSTSITIKANFCQTLKLTPEKAYLVSEVIIKNGSRMFILKFNEEHSIPVLDSWCESITITPDS